MLLKKNTKFGKNNFSILILIFSFYFLAFNSSSLSNDLEGSYTIIKVLDKISSKNDKLKLKNTEEVIFKDLSIKSMKCSKSEFDENPEIKAYIQVKD